MTIQNPSFSNTALAPGAYGAEVEAFRRWSRRVSRRRPRRRPSAAGRQLLQACGLLLSPPPADAAGPAAADVTADVEERDSASCGQLVQVSSGRHGLDWPDDGPGRQAGPEATPSPAHAPYSDRRHCSHSNS